MADGLVSDTEARLRALDRRLLVLRQRAEAAGLALGQAAQDVTMARSFVHGSGVGAAPCVATLAVTVTGCGSVLVSGATVQIKSGATVLASGTTNASGVVSPQLTVSAAGTYDLVISAPRYATSTTSVAMTCAGTTTTAVTLTIGTGYLCSSTCAYPTTLILSDGTSNDVTLTYTTSSVVGGLVGWEGCKVFSSNALVYDNCGFSRATPAPLPIYYFLGVSGTGCGASGLILYYPTCPSSGGHLSSGTCGPFAPSSGSCFGFTQVGTSGTFSPFLYSGSFNFATASFSSNCGDESFALRNAGIYTGTVTFSITE